MIHALTLKSQFLLSGYIHVNRQPALVVLKAPVLRTDPAMAWHTQQVLDSARVVVRLSTGEVVLREDMSIFFHQCQTLAGLLSDQMNPEDVNQGLRDLLRSQH